MNAEIREIVVETIRIYTETHPRPMHVNQVQAAEMLALSVPTVRKLVRAGILPLNKCGLIPITAVDQAAAG